MPGLFESGYLYRGKVTEGVSRRGGEGGGFPDTLLTL